MIRRIVPNGIVAPFARAVAAYRTRARQRTISPIRLKEEARPLPTGPLPNDMLGAKHRALNDTRISAFQKCDELGYVFSAALWMQNSGPPDIPRT
jgi:hypothetical protein